MIAALAARIQYNRAGRGLMASKYARTAMPVSMQPGRRQPPEDRYRMADVLLQMAQLRPGFSIIALA